MCRDSTCGGRGRVGDEVFGYGGEGRRGKARGREGGGQEPQRAGSRVAARSSRRMDKVAATFKCWQLAACRRCGVCFGVPRCCHRQRIVGRAALLVLHRYARDWRVRKLLLDVAGARQAP